jgi:hypothetical protein
MKKNKLIIKGKKLRQDGFSFREISNVLRISKSTASIWLKNEKMSTRGKERFDNFIKHSNIKGVKILADKKQKYLERLDKDCSVLKDGQRHSKNDLKLFLALLYWGEGSKTGAVVDFVNSDPEMIGFYLNLFRKSFAVDERKFRARLHLHSYHDKDQMINFWSGISRIDKGQFLTYTKSNTGIIKRPSYKGCISIRYYDKKILDEILLIISRFPQFKV